VRIMLLGPPGAGKGTQAVRVATALSVPHISTGDILRENVRLGTELGLEAKRFMDAGDLVPDDVIIGMVGTRLDEPDAGTGFVLDGFPRTVPQARALEALLVERDEPLAVVVRLAVDPAEVVDRLSGRRTCDGCGAITHVRLEPSSAPDRCDACGGTLVQRDDDREDVILNRLEVYRTQTEPLEAFYWERGLLRDVDAIGDIDDVHDRVMAIVAAYGGLVDDAAGER
jgi:adenylate kinase